MQEGRARAYQAFIVTLCAIIVWIGWEARVALQNELLRAQKIKALMEMVNEMPTTEEQIELVKWYADHAPPGLVLVSVRFGVDGTHKLTYRKAK